MGQFLKHESCDKCGSSDGKAIYADGSWYCWVCQDKKASLEYLEQFQSKTTKKGYMQSKQEEIQKPISTKPAITEEEQKSIRASTVVNVDYRQVTSKTAKAFGVRYAVDEDGNPTTQYCPCTQEGQLVGYHARELPKSFRSIGRTGSDTELFGQWKFTRGGKYVLITEGQIDCMSAWQMLKDYNESRGSDFETAVVSPTVGANASKQIAAQYKFFDSFDNIILGYDNDAAGQKAAEEIIKHLPKGKVKIMQMQRKDANEYLKAGDEKAFIRDFYNAKTFVPVGVLPSDQLYDRIIQQTSVEKLPFPPFMGKLNEMFVGGIPLGHIINIAASTAVGKTTLVNEMIYYWIFNSPHLVGVVSMELDAGQYGEALMSRHLGRKLALIPDANDKIKELERNKTKAEELLQKPDGTPRFYLLDNRDGSIEEIQDTIEELVVACGCKVIVIDVLTDCLDGLTIDEQAVFMKWAKGFIKSHGITFVFINHTRKPAAGQSSSSMPDEASVFGSSTVTKSASANIFLQRDKTHEDPVVRNSTKIMVPKNRVYGITGPAGAVYYDNETHTLHNLDDWLNGNM